MDDLRKQVKHESLRTLLWITIAGIIALAVHFWLF